MSSENYKIDPIHCKEYLVDGKLKKWEGETSEVYSTIDIKPENKYSPTLLIILYAQVNVSYHFLA